MQFYFSSTHRAFWPGSAGFCISADNFHQGTHISQNLHASGIKLSFLFLLLFLNKILSHVCGSTISTFTPAIIKQIKEKSLVIFRYSLFLCTSHDINECWQWMLCWQNQKLCGGLIMKHRKQRVLLKSWFNSSYLQIPSHPFRKKDPGNSVQFSCLIQYCKYQIIKEKGNKKFKNILWTLICSKEMTPA